MNKNKNLEEFERDLELQKKRVNEKINPILQLYDKGEIDKKEFVEKLAEAFYSLERECPLTCGSCGNRHWPDEACPIRL